MTSVALRQSGGANIISIPKAIVKTLGLHTGSKLDLTIKDNQIVLTPVENEITLEEPVGESLSSFPQRRESIWLPSF